MADNEQLVLSISADTRAMQRQLDKLVKSLGDVDNSAAQAFTKAPPKVDAFTKSMGSAKAQTANLAAQFQDIAVQLQGGSSPLTVALQQGTQISAVLGQQGAAGAVGLLGSAFKSVISPVSLATIAVIALGGAAIQYGAKAIGATRNVDDILKDHSEHIKALKESYGEAGKGVDIYVQKTHQIAQAELGKTTDELEKKFKSLSAAALDSLSSTRTVVTGYGNTLANAGQATDTRFAAFKTQIDALRESAKSGLPDFRTFATQISEIRNTTADAKIKKLADEVLNLIGQLPDMNDKLLSSGKALRNFGSAALEAAAQGEEFAKAMKALGGTVSPDLSEREKIMKNYAAALEKAQGSEERAAAGRVKNDQLAILSANERKKAAEEASRAGESAAKRFQGQLDSVSKRNAQLFGAQSGIGQGVEQLVKLETQYRLTEAAQQAFGKVTPEIAAKIDAVASAAGRAADALAKTKLQSDIGFDRSQIGLSPAEQSANSRLRSVFGDDVNSAQAQFYKQQLLVNDALRQYSDIGKDATKGFISDIISGKSALESLSGALTKISNKLLDMAVDSLWGKAFGGSGGLLSLLGGGGGASGLMQVGNQFFPKFANGTNFAPGGLSLVGERGPELVNLPRGSQVLPASATAKALGQSGATTISYSIDARGADSGTVARIQTVLAQHARAIAGQGRAMQAAQRFQTTGVG